VASIVPGVEGSVPDRADGDLKKFTRRATG